MVRDPWTIFSYWEVKKEIEDKAVNEINNKGLQIAASVLRVYDVTDSLDGLHEKIVFDFELRDFIDKWYIHTHKPGRKWMVEIGIKCTNGEFFPLIRSNIVSAPSYGMSDVFDDKWMCSEDLYYKMFAMSGGYGVGTSSMSLKEMITRRLKEWLSSGGIISGMFGSASLFSHHKK
jgi:hypothetical protein